ncbi:MAG: serine--tRNA ligase [Candidatus Tectomicrobia bacterium]|nr:serine--tRNA ligase [Candidatus Tectomicrobia bacterium]
MLDIRFIREHPDIVKKGAEKKRVQVDIDLLLKIDEERRELLQQVETLRAERNQTSERIPKLQGEEKQGAIARMREVADQLKRLEPTLREREEQFEALMLRVPNIPSEDVPEGESDLENMPLRYWGEVYQPDFPLKDHIELGEALDIIDIPRGVKLAGARTYFLKNEGALLELAILRFAIDHMLKKRFSLMIVPHLVRDEAMIGTAYYPGGEEQAYRIPKDELSMIGTSEVSVTAYHYDEILSEDELPKHYIGYSSCYRREAGAAGKDTRGLYRVHQFQKVEQVIICKNDEAISAQEHDHILRNAEEILQALELPYRVSLVCGGDLGLPQVKKYDIETWMPSRNSYSETHSASKFHDFQARRLRLRYREKGGKIQYAHTLNNTVIASPRILIPILEIYQQEDGSVVIPNVLRPYMGEVERIERKK